MKTQSGKRRIYTGFASILFVALLLGLVVLPAAAQDGAMPIGIDASVAQTININEIRPVTLTPLEPRVRFSLTVSGPTSAIIQALATTPGLVPSVRVLDPSGVLILNVDNAAGLNITQSPVNLPFAGTYTLEIRDRNGAAGELVMAVQPGLPQVPPVGLLPGQQTDGTVGALNPMQVYVFNALPSQALLLHVNGELPLPAPVVSIKDAISGEPIALMSLQLSGVRYRIPLGAASYRVEVAYSGSPAQEPYTVCLETEDGTLPCSPVGGLPPASVPTATPIAPSPTVIVPPPVDPTCLVQSSGGGVNVRTGPDLVYSIVGVLSGGTTAPVIGRSFDGAWWQINFGGSIAWVSAAFTTTTGNCGSVPVASAPPTPVLPSATPIPPTGVPPTGVPPTVTHTPMAPTATNTPGFVPPVFTLVVPVTFVPLFPTATPTPGFVIPPGMIVTLNPGIFQTPFPLVTFTFPGP